MARYRKEEPQTEHGEVDDLSSFADLSLLDRLKEVHGEVLAAEPPKRLLDVLAKARKALKED